MRIRTIALLAASSLGVFGCGGDDDGETTVGAGSDTTAAATDTTAAGADTTASDAEDLLALVSERGTILASTDPAYPPQSELRDDGTYEGFDIDVINEIASRLAVTVEFVTPEFDAITSGGWNGRWDMSVGSVTITPAREEVLNFTDPYYYTPASVAVHTDATYATVEELSGTTIGVCLDCSYEHYLIGDLELAVFGAVAPVITDAEVVTYDTDTTAIADLALGDGARLDAVISALPTLQGSIDNGEPIKIVGDPIFFEPLGIAFDRSAPVDSTTLRDRVNEIVGEMHADGTLTMLSEKWYDGLDYSVTQG